MYFIFIFRSGRSKVANSAVFYFKHSTTEQSSNSSDNEDDEWTFTASNSGKNSTLYFIYIIENENFILYNQILFVDH